MAGAELGGMPVSPPGAQSQRTDMQPVRHVPGMEWGGGQELDAIQGAAPMYAQPAPKPPVGLFAPSERPNEPVTAGIDFGDGPGSEVLTGPGVPQTIPQPSLTQALRTVASAPASSERVATLLRIAERLGW
jgi:hypothetical protein